MSHFRWTVALAIAATMTCAPTTPRPTPFPTNECPAHACSAYASSNGATCLSGACLVPTPIAHFPNLILVAALPNDAALSPGRTYARRVADLDASAPPGSAPSVLLPQPGPVFGYYQVEPHVANDLLHWNLGNPNFTLLPTKVTYRLLWTAALVDALDAGLPTYPVFADQTEQPGGAPGPGNGPSFQFRTSLPPGTYEQTVTPLPPFDQAFPPDISVVVVPGGTIGPVNLNMPDTTIEIRPRSPIPQGEIPRFDIDISQVTGLDGSIAYLRDATTRRPLSPIQSIRAPSTPDGGVLLATSHHPPPEDGGSDALWNAELVIVPPAGSRLPTYVVRPQANEIPRGQVYPALPPLVPVQGTIASADGTGVAANVIYEARMIYYAPQLALPADAGAGVTGSEGSPTVYVPNTENFELVTRTHTELDASGVASYSIVLPPGQYRRVVLPLDTPNGSSDSTFAMKSDVISVGLQAPIVTDDVLVAVPSLVDGIVLIGDGRPLPAATVEAIPMHCPPIADVDGAAIPGDSASCLPRAAQQQTGSDGTFRLRLDPGSYLLRVEPPDGTRLPWTSQSLDVPTSSPVSPVSFWIPPPVYAGMVLTDEVASPIRGAVVRMFVMESAGPALEVGSAITDANGHFDMYLDPNLLAPDAGDQ